MLPVGDFTQGDGAYQTGVLVYGSVTGCGRPFGGYGGLHSHGNANRANADSDWRNAVTISRKYQQLNCTACILQAVFL